MKLTLNQIAAHLEALEETIIFQLMARAQYKQNLSVYQPGKSGFSGFDNSSLLDLRILKEEEMDSQFGRFTVPEERPFNKDLPKVVRVFDRPPCEIPLKDFDEVNLTAKIKEGYTSFIPFICQEGDDHNYGSSVEYDMKSLRAISERIHYGSMYVAERKFQDNPKEYIRSIIEKDTVGLLIKLTRKKVEENILVRVYEKSVRYQEGINPSIRHRIDPNIIKNIYETFIIPCTKAGEIRYLLSRGIN